MKKVVGNIMKALQAVGSVVLEVVQQEIPCRHQRKSAELHVVPDVVGHNNVATGGKRALVLKKVFKIANVFMVQGNVQLRRIARKHDDTLTEATNKLIALLTRCSTLDIIDVGVRKVRDTILNLTRFPQIENGFSQAGIVPVVGDVNQDISVQENFHLSPRIYRVRSSVASSGVSLSHSTSSWVSGDTLISAIFCDRNSSSSLRLASSASRIASLRNSMTKYMSLTFISRISPIYGAIGVDKTRFAAVVITLCFAAAKIDRNSETARGRGNIGNNHLC